MHIRQYLLEQLSRVNNRYNELLKLFGGFHTEIGRQFNNSASPPLISGARVSENENSQFSIEFVGRTLQFKFSAIADEEKLLHGHVDCFIVNKMEPKDSVLLFAFQFDGQGVSSIVMPENTREYLNVRDDLEAPHIVLHCLYESLSKPASYA